ILGSGSGRETAALPSEAARAGHGGILCVRDDIKVDTVEAVPLAVVRRRISPREVAAAWRPALDLVWAFLRARDGLWAGGHNVFVYRRGPDPGAPLTVDFGVQVVRSFEGDGTVIAGATPPGRVASTRHVGPVEGLAAAYAALDGWLIAHDEVRASVSWETYGDWGPDPATWEVRVTYLLADAARPGENP
ncbi:MAG TPA: GyrI-like domain-containing protein, partial [Candidatus Binatus sp.]|nr:GyrI-like domain-containing protein [Candidatus Binatus sp.]